LATLIAVLLPNLMGTRQKARDSKKIQDLETMKNALRMYYNDNQNYPEGVGTTDISDDVDDYLPGVDEIEYEYYQTNSGDGFWLCVDLEAGMGGEDVKSLQRCGIGSTQVCGLDIGSTQTGKYVICTN